MKKLLLILAIVAGINLYAQDVKFGAKSGLNISGYHGQDANDGGALYAFHAGPVVEIKFSNKLALQPELLFSMQGAKFNRETIQGDKVVANTEGETKANYLNLPIMAKYYIIDGLALELGPQLGFLMSRDLEYTTKTIAGDITKASTDSKDDLNSIDYSLGAGASYKMPFGLITGLRYNYGFNNYYKETTEANDDLKNMTIQLYVGYMF